MSIGIKYVTELCNGETVEFSHPTPAEDLAIMLGTSFHAKPLNKIERQFQDGTRGRCFIPEWLAESRERSMAGDWEGIRRIFCNSGLVRLDVDSTVIVNVGWYANKVLS